MINQYTITRTVYRVVCSECGDLGPEGHTEKEAVQAAFDDNWTMRTIFPSGEMVEVFTCPNHQEGVADG
jgi:hypothetical protein